MEELLHGTDENPYDSRYMKRKLIQLHGTELIFSEK